MSNPYNQYNTSNNDEVRVSYGQPMPQQEYYLPNQQQQGAGVQYGSEPYSQQNYNYDIYNIGYTQMSVTDFSSQPVDKTEYSQYWDGPQAFEPQTFAANSEEPKKKYNDVGWIIAFWLNFLVTIGIFVWLVYEGWDFVVQTADGTTSINWKFIGKAGGLGLAIALVVNILHFVYAAACPLFYIKFGLVVGLIVSIVIGVIAIWQCSIWFIIFPILTLIFTILFYIMMCRHIKFSAAVFKMTTKIITEHFSIVFFSLFEALIEIIISIIFSLIFVLVEECNKSYWLYLYVLLSYLWINLTFGYVGYMTGAGLTASWYFLTGTEYFPEHPVWDSFRRAMSTSFGSASVAGFLLAIVRFFRALIDSIDSRDSCILCIFKCIALCVLNCLDYLISWMNRFGLIYCAVFGVPFKEGCRRYAELTSKRFVNLIMRSCVIDNSLTYNFLVFVAGAGVIGYFVGWAIFEHDSLWPMFTCIFAVIFGFSIFEMLEQPMSVISDTIFLCFAENPEKLQTSAHELYDIIVEMYGEELGRVMQ